jgi:hypothetical protein
LLCPFASGCGLFYIGARNLCNEAKLIRDSRCEEIRYAYLAHEAWEHVKASSPLHTYSPDYVAGFHAGFADYLYAGGCGDPPAMPPKHYRHFHAESPRGAKALQDWYGGFRHATTVAKESGLRQFVIVSLAPPATPQLPPLPPPIVPLPSIPAAGPPSELSSPLPAPRKVPRDTPSEAEGTADEAGPKGLPEAPSRAAPRPSKSDHGSAEGNANQSPRIDEATEKPPDQEEQP